MLLDLLSTEPYVQLGFLAAIVAIVCAALAKNRSEKAHPLEIQDRADARIHEVEMWRVKQGVIEHKK